MQLGGFNWQCCAVASLLFISVLALFILLLVMGTSVCYQQFILRWKSAKSYMLYTKKNCSNLSYKYRLIKAKLLPLNYWLEYLNLVFFFTCLHGHNDLNHSFNYYFSFVTCQTHQACSGLNLKININCTSFFQDFYLNSIANWWNNNYTYWC